MKQVHAKEKNKDSAGEKKKAKVKSAQYKSNKGTNSNGK